MMRDEDSQRIARARAGDSDAFRQLVEAHSAGLFRLAYRLTGETEAAEDVVQEAFLKAYRALDRFDGRAKFSTWLHRITANCAMDLLRRRGREAARLEPLADSADPLHQAVSEEPGPLRRAASAELLEQLDQALDRLTPVERTAFVLRHFEQQSTAEISRALGGGVSSAKQAVFRAVRKLRRDLEPWTEKRYA